MMTAEQLRGSILQLAMQGQLVEQRPEEGSGEELYKQIKAEKKRLIKEGTIKAGKKYDAISEEEITFDIPDTWVWTRLSDIVFNRGQKKPENAFSYIDIGSIDNVHQKLNDEENIIEPENAPSRARKIVEIGDVIYSTVRPYLHNMCIIDRMFSREPIASTGFAVMTCHEGLYNKFLFYFLLTPAFDRYANDTENSKGVAYPAINDQKLYKALVPIPPLGEQKRIVAKIEELIPFVEQYAVAGTKLNTLNATFPDMMKKSILQEAVQGKLVPQDPNDEPVSVLLKKIAEEKKRLIKEGKIKKQKPLPEITEDEIPFDIPESWKWVRLADISKQITDGEHSTPKRVSDFCGYYLLSARNVRDGEIKLDDVDYVDRSEFERMSSRCNPVNGDILITCSGSVGRCAVVNDDNNYVMVRSAAMASPIMCDPNYLMYTIQSDCVQRQVNALKKQTAQANLFLGAISVLNIPLPPYNEQKRIVNRLNQILNHTEKAFNTLSFE